MTSLTDVGGTLFFAQALGHGLWKSDGTEAGTTVVKNINSEGSSSPGWLIDAGGTLFFSADGGSGRALWKSDGTEAGTERVIDVGGSIVDVAAADDLLFFLVAFVEDDSYEEALYVTDGTATGTEELFRAGGVQNSPYVGAPISPRGLTWTGTHLFFVAGADITSLGASSWDLYTVTVPEPASGAWSA